MKKFPDFVRHIEAVCIATEKHQCFNQLIQLLKEKNISPREVFSISQPPDIQGLMVNKKSKVGKLILIAGICVFCITYAIQYITFNNSGLDLPMPGISRFLSFVPVSFVFSLLVASILALGWFWSKSLLMPGTIPQHELTSSEYHVVIQYTDYQSIKNNLELISDLKIQPFIYKEIRKRIFIPFNLNKI